VTRRAFVSALGAAAAALAVRRATRGLAPGDGSGDGPGDDDRAPSRWTGTTRWIGHC
jgi:hypothetical protein